MRFISPTMQQRSLRRSGHSDGIVLVHAKLVPNERLRALSLARVSALAFGVAIGASQLMACKSNDSGPTSMMAGPALAAGSGAGTASQSTAGVVAVSPAAGVGSSALAGTNAGVAGLAGTAVAGMSASGGAAGAPTAGLAGTGASGAAAGAAGNAGTGAGSDASAAGSGGESTGFGGSSAAGSGGSSGSIVGSGGMDASSAGAGSGVAGADAAGAGGSGAAGSSAASGPLTLTSSAFMNGAKLPSKYRCMMLGGSSGPSPELSWSGGPVAQSYAMTLTDITNNIAHWTLYDIPAATMTLPEAVPLGAMPAMPAGAKQTPNQFAQMTGPGYFGPCGGAQPNMYQFEVYALDVATLPGVTSSSTAAQARMAIMMHSLAMGTATLDVTSSTSDP